MSTKLKGNDGSIRKKRKGRKRGPNSYARIEILRSIAKSEPQGRRIWDLTEDQSVRIKDRTTVSKYCNDLVNEGYIYKNNKLSPYHITSKARGEPEIKAYFFKKEFMNKLSKLEILDEDPDIQKMSPEQLDLFDFSNKIGALITYACIEAVSPYKLNNRVFDWEINEKDLKFTGKLKDQYARQWLRNVINPDTIFDQFCNLECVKVGRAIHSPRPIKKFSHERFGNEKNYQAYVKLMNEIHLTHRKFDPNNPEWSSSEVDITNFKKLKLAFKSVYPHLFDILEKLKIGLENKLREERKFRMNI